MPVEVLTVQDLAALELRLTALETRLTFLVDRMIALERIATPPPPEPPEPAPPEEPPPEESPPASVGVEYCKHITGDPQTYSLGWASAFAVKDPASGRTLFMPVFGHSHSPTNDNSIRGFDPIGKTWTTYQGNKGSLKKWDQYVCQRDNYLGWYVPWRDELWVVGGAGETNNGIFSFVSKTWTHIYPRFEFGTDGIIGIPAGARDPWKRQNAMTATCPELQSVLYCGGEDTLGNPQNRLAIIEPNPGGPEPFRYVELEGPISVMRCRNNMAITGTTCYFTGGTVKAPGGNSTLSLQTWKLDLATRRFTRLADAPLMTDYPMVTWDAALRRLVVFSGQGKRMLLVFNPADNTWSDLSSEIPDIAIKNGCGTYIDGIHYYRGGSYQVKGVDQGWSWSRNVYGLRLAASAAPEPAGEPKPEPEPESDPEPDPDPEGKEAAAPVNPAPSVEISIRTVAWDSKVMRPPMKHIKVLYHKGFFYFMGGDFSGPEHVQSYRQEGPIRLDPARGAWTCLHPYCAVPPDTQPLGPDMCGWLHVGEGDSLLLIPGLQLAAQGNACPGVKGKAFRFLLTTEKWQEVEGQNSLFDYVTSTVTDNLPTVWTYDPQTRAAYAVGYYGEILRYDVATAQFAQVVGNPFKIKATPNKSSTALIGRELYLFDSTAQRLLAWHIDTQAGRVVNAPPFTVRGGECHIGYLPWLEALFVHDYAGLNSTSWLYRPDGDSYEKLDLKDAAGRRVRSRALAVDPDGQRVLMAGHSDYPRWDAPKDPAWLVEIA